MATAKKLRVLLWFYRETGEVCLHPMLKMETACSSCWRAESFMHSWGWFCPLLWWHIPSWCSNQIRCGSRISLDKVVQCFGRVLRAKTAAQHWKAHMKGSEIFHENQTVERGKQSTEKAGQHSLCRSTHQEKVGCVFTGSQDTCGRDRSSEGQLEKWRTRELFMNRLEGKGIQTAGVTGSCKCLRVPDLLDKSVPLVQGKDFSFQFSL